MAGDHVATAWVGLAGPGGDDTRRQTAGGFHRRCRWRRDIGRWRNRAWRLCGTREGGGAQDQRQHGRCALLHACILTLFCAIFSFVLAALLCRLVGAPTCHSFSPSCGCRHQRAHNGRCAMPHFKKLTPNLLVANVERSLAFYCDVLGFNRGMTVPEQPPFVFAQAVLVTTNGNREFADAFQRTLFPVAAVRFIETRCER